MLLRSAASRLKREDELKQAEDQQTTKIPECDDREQSKNEDVNNGVDSRSNGQRVMEAYYPVVLSRKKDPQDHEQRHTSDHNTTKRPSRSQKRKQRDDTEQNEEQPNSSKKPRALGNKDTTKMKNSTIISWFTFYVPRPEPPFKMPATCLHRIMEYSDARVCHILATSRKDLYNMLTYRLVVRAAILSAPNYNMPSKLRMQCIMSGINQGSMLIPSPQRLLSLLNGKYCEMGLCCYEREHRHDSFLYKSEGNLLLGVPFALECGLFICNNCAQCSSIPSESVHSEKYKAILGFSFKSHGGVYMYWRAPYATANGKRIGPIMTMTDADAIVLGKKSKEEVVDGHQSAAKRQIMEAYSSTSSKTCTPTPPPTTYNEKLERYSNTVRDHFVQVIIDRSGHKIWIELAIERNANGAFRWHPQNFFGLQTREQECVCAWEGSQTKLCGLLRKWVDAIDSHFDDHYREMASVGIHDVSFLEDGRTPVEQYWYKKWKSALKKDKNFMWKASMGLNVRSDHLERNPFPNLAQHMFGNNFRTKLITEALPKKRMTMNSGPKFDAEMRRLWREANSDLDHLSWCWYDDFEERCEHVYDGMMAKFGKGDDDEEPS